MRRDVFSGYHPAVGFLYFAAVVTFTMVFFHPVMLAVSLAASSAYAVYLKGKKAARLLMFGILPMALITMALNPLFNHEGATILLWLPNGNPLTLEAMLYGAASAAMLSSAVIWFVCINGVLTSDKFVWLSGRAAPALSLMISMALRLVPRLAARMRETSAARKAAGGADAGGNIRHAVSVLSAAVSWALEGSIETADSMKCRGYGLSGRTSYSNYRWSGRDSAALVFILYCSAYIALGGISGGTAWRYYPLTGGELTSPYAVSVFVAYFALCAFPMYLNVKERLEWKYSLSEN